MSSGGSVRPASSFSPWPAIVAGLGGSGTRAVVKVLRAAGVDMGTYVNATEDALSFNEFAATWMRPYLRHLKGEFEGFDHTAMARDLHRAVARHSADLAARTGPWGWKRPALVFIVPFLHQQLPNFTFIHVIRNGLDMAFSSNQSYFASYGDILLGRAHEHEPVPLQSLRIWEKANQRAADYAETHLPARYFRLRFEDLCGDPLPTIASLFGFLGLAADPVTAARAVEDPGTIHRWRQRADARLTLRLLRAAEPAQRRFGYWDEGTYRECVARAGRLRAALLPLEEQLSWLADRGRRAAYAAREGRVRSALRKRLEWLFFRRARRKIKPL